VCARGDGIRGSQDLRAEVRKYLISTNERKQMSIKTLRKRIALVAVATLGAGVLSVAPANAATYFNSGADYDFSSTITGSNYGICFVGATAATGNASGINTLANNSTNTAEMLVTGQLAVTGTVLLNASGDSIKISVTGPATVKALTLGTAGTTSGVDGKSLTSTASGATQSAAAFAINPTGVGTVQVEIVENDGGDTTTSQTLEVITITVRSSCLAGTASASGSGAKFVADGDKATAMTSSNVTSNDASGQASASNGNHLFLRFDMFDANGTAVPNAAATGTVTAETTGGALIGFQETGTTTLAYTVNKAGWLKISQGTADAPWSGTVTIKLNGTPVFTKSGKITGKADSIVTSSLVNVEMAQTATAGRYVVLDSAKNEIAEPITKLEDFSQANATIGAAGSSTRTPVPGTADNRGTFTVNCSGSKGGTLTGLRLQYTFSNLTSIYSAPFNVTCGSATVATYTASLDKASYVPGDIATLTINAKDAFGNQVADSAVMGTASTGEGVSIAGSNLTAVTAPTNSDTFAAGAKTYRFVVGSTEGSYNLVVDLDKWTTSTYSQSAVVVPYAIKASTSTVSNADVLKSIVALIASINKQIQALQKLILRR
jgi:trimeric autotransporter adhesin